MSEQDAGFWRRFWSGIRGNSYLDKNDVSNPFTSVVTNSDAIVTPDNAMKLSAVWACVQLKSETIASLPLHLYDDTNKVVKSHDLYPIIHTSPNADMTAIEFWIAMNMDRNLTGNSYALIHRNRKKIVSLEKLNANNMKVVREKSGRILYIYYENNKEFEYVDDDVFHIKGLSRDGLVGISPIRAHAEMLGLQIAADQTAGSTFKSNLKVGGFLKTGAQTLKKEQRESLRDSLSQFSSPENAGKWLVLEAGMEPSTYQASISPVDAQLLESRYFGIEEICRIYGVPPQLIGYTSKASSWASSLEQTNLGFLTYNLRPDLIKIEQSISKKLLSPAERQQYKPSFVVEGLLRANSVARAQYYATMVQNGIMDRNEVREKENLMPRDGADELTVQLNMGTINDIEKIGNNDENKD